MHKADPYTVLKQSRENDQMGNGITTEGIPDSYAGSLSAGEIARWREEFPILDKVIHCGNCSQSPQSHRVRAAIDEYLNNWLTVGMDWNSWVSGVETARAEFAKLINCEPKDVAVVSSVSAAVSAIVGALPRDGRKSLIATEMDFPTIGQILQANAARDFKVEFVAIENEEIVPAAYEKALRKDTAVVFMPHAYYESGYLQEVAPIAEMCRSNGTLLAVDAYQSMGSTSFDVKRERPHFVYSGNLKYLLGIPGIAFLYVDPEIADSLSPTATGWFGQRDIFAFKLKELEYAPFARRFDSGTPPVLAAFAAAEGMRIINEIGADRIAASIGRVKAAGVVAAERAGLRIAGPEAPRHKGATIAVVTKKDPHHIEHELKQEGIICTARGRVVRCAPHFFTTEDEMVKAIERIAALDRS